MFVIEYVDNIENYLNYRKNLVAWETVQKLCVNFRMSGPLMTRN